MLRFILMSGLAEEAEQKEWCNSTLYSTQSGEYNTPCWRECGRNAELCWRLGGGLILLGALICRERGRALGQVYFDLEYFLFAIFGFLDLLGFI